MGCITALQHKVDLQQIYNTVFSTIAVSVVDHEVNIFGSNKKRRMHAIKKENTFGFTAEVYVAHNVLLKQTTSFNVGNCNYL